MSETENAIYLKVEISGMNPNDLKVIKSTTSDGRVIKVKIYKLTMYSYTQVVFVY
jgi:hypothetical protein